MHHNKINLKKVSVINNFVAKFQTSYNNEETTSFDVITKRKIKSKKNLRNKPTVRFHVVMSKKKFEAVARYCQLTLF